MIYFLHCYVQNVLISPYRCIHHLFQAQDGEYKMYSMSVLELKK
jgi:hypothetical protein